MAGKKEVKEKLTFDATAGRNRERLSIVKRLVDHNSQTHKREIAQLQKQLIIEKFVF